MKIKTKKQMNLHELIKWAWDNDVVKEGFLGRNDCTVSFGRNGEVHVDLATPNETFTVEVEEEITEDTEIPYLLEIYKLKDEVHSIMWKERSMKTLLELVNEITISSFYVVDDDGELTLICKNGEMVE